MRLLSEEVKMDIALTSANSNGVVIGPYYSLVNYRKALFIVELGAMVAGATSVLQVLQAKDAGGEGSGAITHSTATITANTKVTEAKFTAAACAPGDTCVINGITLTGAAAEDVDAGKFLAKADGNNDTAASLAKVINANVPGVIASAADAVVTVKVAESGEGTVTVEGTPTRLAAATLKAIGYVECDESYLDDRFTHVALQVTNSAAIQTGAVLLRGRAGYSLAQHVAASKVDVAAGS